MNLQLVDRALTEIGRDGRKREMSSAEMKLFRDVTLKMIEANKDMDLKEIEVTHEHKKRRLKASTDMSLKQMEVLPVVFGFLSLAAVLIATTGTNDFVASGVLILLIGLFGFIIMVDSVKALQLQYDDVQEEQVCFPSAQQLTYDGFAPEHDCASGGRLHLFFSVLFTALFFGMTAGFDAFTGMATALSVVAAGHRCTRLWHYYVDNIQKCIPAAILIDLAGVLAATKANIGVTMVVCLATILILIFELNLRIEETYRALVFATIFVAFSQSKSYFAEAGPSVSIGFAFFTMLLGAILLYDKIDDEFRIEVRRSILRVALASGANILTEEVSGFSCFPIMAVAFIMMLYVKCGQGMLMWRHAVRATGLTHGLGNSYKSVFSDLTVATVAAGNAYFRRGIENLGFIYGVTYMSGFMLFLELIAA